MCRFGIPSYSTDAKPPHGKQVEKKSKYRFCLYLFHVIQDENHHPSAQRQPLAHRSSLRSPLGRLLKDPWCAIFGVVGAGALPLHPQAYDEKSLAWNLRLRMRLEAWQ